MTLLLKVISTAWTSALLIPILIVLIGYAKGSCGEYDPCSTGAALPYAKSMAAFAIILAIIQFAFLVTVWRAREPVTTKDMS
eukprot:gene17448-17639_t